MEGDFVKGISKPGAKNFQKYQPGEKRGRDYNQDRDFQQNKRPKHYE